MQAEDSTEFVAVHFEVVVHFEEEVLQALACSQLEEDMGVAAVVVEVQTL